MNKIRTRAFILSFTLFFVASISLRAQVKPDSVFKAIKELSLKIVNNDLTGDALAKLKDDSAATKKTKELKTTLGKVASAKQTDPALDKTLRGLSALSFDNDNSVKTSLPDFAKDFTQLKSLIKSYKTTPAKLVAATTQKPAGAKKPPQQAPIVKKDTPKPQTPNAATTAAHPGQDSATIVKLKKNASDKEGNIQAKNAIIQGDKIILAANQQKISNLTIALYAVIFCVIVLAVLFFRARKTNAKLTATNEEQEGALNTLKREHAKLNDAYQQLYSTNQTLKERESMMARQTPVAKPPGQFEYKPQPLMPLLTDIPVNGTYFFGEAMVTAGPRKNFDKDASEGDYGLGEDVAGLIIRKDKAFFWVLDGTSDSDRLVKPLVTADNKQEEYFSSRLLAQSIGWNLQLLIGNELPVEFNAALLLQKAIKTTEHEWKDRIGRLDNASYEALTETLNDKNGVLQCSTTAVFGVLCLDGRLDICRIGDTKIIAYPGENLFPRSTGRQFVTLQQKGGDEVSLAFNDFTDVRSQIIQLTNISTLMVMTDGISNQMENWLKNSPGINFTEKTTREIFARFNQNTYDDKAMCIIQIK